MTEDLCTMQVTGWSVLVKDRTRWRHTVKKARPTSGCSATWLVDFHDSTILFHNLCIRYRSLFGMCPGIKLTYKIVLN